MVFIFVIACHQHLYRNTSYFLFLSLSPSLTLKVLTYPLIIANIKANSLITSSKYPIKYLKLIFVSINFETTILLTLTSQILIGILHDKIPLILLLSY